MALYEVYESPTTYQMVTELIEGQRANEYVKEAVFMVPQNNELGS